MQDFYGEQPFILQGKSTKSAKNNQKINVGINKIFIFWIILIFLAAIFVSAFYIYRAVYTVESGAKTYYAVCFYSGTDRAQAESVQSALIASGGSGYIVNDGRFSVFGAVFDSEEQAESVVSKQQSNASVVAVGWEEVEIMCGDKEQAKILKSALGYFEKSVDNLIVLSLSLDNYEETDASVYLFTERMAAELLAYSDRLSDPTCADFFSACSSVIKTDFINGSEGNVNSRLKKIIHELIVFRQNLSV